MSNTKVLSPKSLDLSRKGLVLGKPCFLPPFPLLNYLALNVWCVQERHLWKRYRG